MIPGITWLLQASLAASLKTPKYCQGSSCNSWHCCLSRVVSSGPRIKMQVGLTDNFVETPILPQGFLGWQKKYKRKHEDTKGIVYLGFIKRFVSSKRPINLTGFLFIIHSVVVLGLNHGLPT